MSLNLKHVLAWCIAGIAVGVFAVATYLSWPGGKTGGEPQQDFSAQAGPGLWTSRTAAVPDDPAFREAIESIIVPQDRPNTTVKVTLEPGDETVDTFENWKMQHLKTGEYRIVDPLGFQRAVGSEQAMRKSFEVIRSQLID